jgi:hypothetical protein
MYVEDYSVMVKYVSCRYKTYTSNNFLNILDKVISYNLANKNMWWGTPNGSLTIGFAGVIDLLLQFRICYVTKVVSIHIRNLKSILDEVSQNSVAFLRQTIKNCQITSSGYKVIWTSNKKFATKFGFWKLIKPKKGINNMDYQKKYDHVRKEASKFALKAANQLDKHDFANHVNKFLDVNTKDLRNHDDVHLAKFCKDFERRMNNLAKNHSKESLSKFLHYLDNCPSNYEDYKTGKDQ